MRVRGLWVAGERAVGWVALGVLLALVFWWWLVLWAAAAFAAALAAGATLAAWAAIGFDGLADYPELLRRLSDVVANRGFSLVALGVEAGLPRGAAEALPWLVGLALLAGVVVIARREDVDRNAFSLAIFAAIALTPIVWLHYFALLIMPLALARPRLSWAWG